MPSDVTNPIDDLLETLHHGLRTVTDGVVTTYIPELAHADPDWFGVALATLDGHIYAAGDADRPFTMQSVSKPFVYALALADRGLDEVITKVGVEPSGDAFNAIRLEPGTGRPPNAMVNAGAILTSTLVEGGFERILAGLARFAGRPLDVDERVYASEFATGDRNRALAYLMRNAGALTTEVEPAVSIYFRQCSVRVTARDLAIMSVTLANAGVNPITGERVVDRDTASHVLTVMATCGMYDFAGEWLLRVGLPAKSGVSGAIAAALPAQFGIGLFSPPLDARGNSVRGIAACEELSARFGLHLMRPAMRSASAVYLSGTAAVHPSTAQRSPDERDLLRREGAAIVLRGLQGDIGFASAEALTRDVTGQADGVRWFVLDVDRVGRLHPVAERLLDTLSERLSAHGIATVIADGNERDLMRAPQLRFPTLDEALRWCEDALLDA